MCIAAQYKNDFAYSMIYYIEGAAVVIVGSSVGPNRDFDKPPRK